MFDLANLHKATNGCAANDQLFILNWVIDLLFAFFRNLAEIELCVICLLLESRKEVKISRNQCCNTLQSHLLSSSFSQSLFLSLSLRGEKESERERSINEVENTRLYREPLTHCRFEIMNE